MSRIEELERRVLQDPASITFGALAEEYRRAGRFGDAVAVCRAGLERHPSYVSARVTLGRALQELGQADEARAEFTAVLAIAPDNLAAIRGLAELHAEAEEAEEEQQTGPPPAQSVPDVAFDPPAPPPGSQSEETVSRVPDAAASQRAAQVERLEIWLARLEEMRRAARDAGFTS